MRIKLFTHQTIIFLVLIVSVAYGQEYVTKMRISVILVKEADKATEIWQLLQKGADFSKLAKQYTIGPNRDEGGDLGYFAPGEMMKELNDTAIELKVGEYSEPVKVENGYFILLKTKEKIAPWETLELNANFYRPDLLLAETLEETRQALREEPDNSQLKANLGWLYIQSGKFDEGFQLLIDVQIEPSYESALLFPIATDSVERRQLYLKTIKAFNDDLDETRLVLGHIFTSHLSREHIIDKLLISELRALAEESESPLIYDALNELSYPQQEHRINQVEYAEAVISQIKALSFDIHGDKHFSHFYYNAACGHSIQKDYEMAERRLNEAFSIHSDLRSWSLRDPDLENLRDHIGMERFQKIIDQSH